MIVNADNQGTSTRPYLVRALHEWCTDNGFTPYLAVYVDSSVQVPMEHVKNNEIVLNVGFEATSGLKLGNEQVEFRARFGGVSRDIVVPMDHVVAIYARENGQGMAFPVPTAASAAATAAGLAEVPAPTAAAPRGLRLASVDSDKRSDHSSDKNSDKNSDKSSAKAGSDSAVDKAAAALGKATGKSPAAAATVAPALALTDSGDTPGPSDPEPTPPAGGRPSLKRVK
jgi:stringent starvation protein B